MNNENNNNLLHKGNLGYAEEVDEISLKKIILSLKKWYSYVVSKWIIIGIIAFTGGVIAFIYAYYKKVEYVANLNFVLSNGDSKGLSQYSSLASMVGIDIGGGSSGNDLFSGDNILELYKSRKMLQKTLLSEGHFDNKSQLFIDRFISYGHLNNTQFKKVKPSDLVFNHYIEGENRARDSVFTVIISDLNKSYLEVTKPDKDLNIINVKVQSDDEVFAKEFTNQLVSNVNAFYVETKTKKEVENVDILQHQADSIRRELNAAISGVAISIDANPNPNSAKQILKVPSQKRQVDIEADKAILTELVKNLEVSKLSLRKETPLIQVIDVPVLPLERIRLGKVKAALVGGIICAFLTIFFIVLKKIYNNILTDYEQ